MYGKAYLRPGTDVGVRDTLSGKIHDVWDKEKHKKRLPHHDFSTQVHITPSSFRRGHQEIMDERLNLGKDTDQTIANVRPSSSGLRKIVSTSQHRIGIIVVGLKIFLVILATRVIDHCSGY